MFINVSAVKKTRNVIENDCFKIMIYPFKSSLLRGIRPDIIYCDENYYSEEMVIMRYTGSIVHIMKKLSY